MRRRINLDLIMQDLLNVGIDSIGFYAPKYYINLEDLAKARNEEYDKYRIGLLIKEFRFTDVNEDVISLGFHAARFALKRGNIDPKEIDGVLVGTETQTYAAKSVSNIFTEILNLNQNCLTQDIYNACAAGTLAIINAISLIEMDVINKALVIVADISSYAKGSKAEPTQGAGAVALVISKNPRICSFSRLFGRVSANIDDYFRPKNQKDAEVFGKYSVQSYLNLQLRAYENLKDKIGDIFADYFIFHGPFASLPLKLMYQLISKHWLNRIGKFVTRTTPIKKSAVLDRIFSKISIIPDFILDELSKLTSNSEELEKIKMELQDTIKNSFLPQLHIPLYFGNMYSASLWAQLQYILETSASVNDIIYFGSYGSGAICISGLIKINEKFKEVINNKPTVIDIMKKKLRKTISEYESIKEQEVKANIKWGLIEPLKNLNSYYEFSYCDHGCMLAPLSDIDYCPKAHKGKNNIIFPTYGKVASIDMAFNEHDITPILRGYVPILDNPEIGTTVEMGFRRINSINSSKQVKGLLNWIPTYSSLILTE